MTAMTGPYIGVINAGSSSIKFALFSGDDSLLNGQIEGIGIRPAMRVAGPASERLPPLDLHSAAPATSGEAAPLLLSWLREHLRDYKIAAIGHRVVHGGTRFTMPTRINGQVINELEALIPLAPLHQPHNVGPMKSILKTHPDLPQVACFDTAFHRTNPDIAQAFALPIQLRDEGVRRYGFHGLSYEYIASALPKVAPDIASGRIVMHLGNGASACAIRSRESMASTVDSAR